MDRSESGDHNPLVCIGKVAVRSPGQQSPSPGQSGEGLVHFIKGSDPSGAEVDSTLYLYRKGVRG